MASEVAVAVVMPYTAGEDRNVDGIPTYGGQSRH